MFEILSVEKVLWIRIRFLPGKSLAIILKKLENINHYFQPIFLKNFFCTFLCQLLSATSLSSVRTSKVRHNIYFNLNVTFHISIQALSILLLCNVNNEERSIVFVCEDRKQYELWLAGFQVSLI